MITNLPIKTEQNSHKVVNAAEPGDYFPGLSHVI